MSFLSFVSSCIAQPKETPVNTPFGKAQAAFRTEVAAQYGRKAGDLTLVPATEAGVSPALRTGELIALQARWTIQPARKEGSTQWWVGGYASESGKVVLEKKGNLGELLRAAHFADEKQSPGAREMAERVLWMGLEAMGQPQSPAGPQPPSFVLVESGGFVRPIPGPGSNVEQGSMAPPAIERGKDGSATLVLFYAYDASPGVARNARLRLGCTADYQVKLEVSPLMIPGRGPF